MTLPVKKLKKSPGRPSNYDPLFCEKIIDLAGKGAFVAEMCMELGIRSRDTFYRWVKEYPEFGRAYETAQLYGQAFYEKQGRMMISGEVKGNHSVWTTVMQNRYSDEYKRPQAETNIHINQINNIAQLSSEELDKAILEYQKKLGLITEAKIVEAEYREIETDGTH